MVATARIAAAAVTEIPYRLVTQATSIAVSVMLLSVPKSAPFPEDPGPHLIHGSLGPRESATPQTASRDVDRFIRFCRGRDRPTLSQSQSYIHRHSVSSNT